jgi:hypothetical protein
MVSRQSGRTQAELRNHKGYFRALSDVGEGEVPLVLLTFGCIERESRPPHYFASDPLLRPRLQCIPWTSRRCKTYAR